MAQSPSSVVAPGAACPTTVDAATFADARQLRDLLGAFNAFGLRTSGSAAGDASLDWLGKEFAAIPGAKVRWDPYEIDAWQPSTPDPNDARSRSLAAAGSLRLKGRDLPVAGAVPFAAPTSEAGVSAPLVVVPPGQQITTANSQGRIVVRQVPHETQPWAGIVAISHYATPDLPRTGDYDRPYTRPLDQELHAAEAAGARGMVLVFDDAPTDQLRGYWDPHTGARFTVPAVFVGSDALAGLTEAAARGEAATVVVRASWGKATARNLSVTLPGQSRERIVLTANSDSMSWVQENGTIGSLALLRWFAALPLRCRPRDIEIELTASHLAMATDGSSRTIPALDRGYDDDTVAFVVALEHLGARRIEPGADGRLHVGDDADLLAWSAPTESPVLIDASIAAVKRRALPATAVFIGAGGFSGPRPRVCSQGGLGTGPNMHLIPTLGIISGAWSMWAPSFGADAIDPELYRRQLLAIGDVVVGLGETTRDKIAGGFTRMRAERAEGKPTCLDP